MNEYYVYEWFIVDTNEVFYVGKGKNNRYLTISGRNKFFMDMYNSHTCNVRKVYENLSEQDAFLKEMELIAYYRNNTSFRLTNQTDGGEGSSGWVPTDEFRKKQSDIHKQQWQDEEFKNRMIEIRKNENGPYKSKEFREKISSIVSGENNPNYGHNWTQEMKDNLSELRKRNGLSAGINNPKATKIICLETGEVFNLIKDAMEKYNVTNEGSFTVALKNRARTAGGMHWMVYDNALIDESYRFNELLISLSLSVAHPIICIETKEVFNNRTEFLNKFHMCKDTFNKKYTKDGSIIVNGKHYMYIKEYIHIRNEVAV